MAIPRTLLELALALSTAACELSPEDARLELGRLGVDFTGQALVQAVANDDVRAVELFLIAGMDPDSEVSGWASTTTPLKQAVAGHNGEIIEMLLAGGADPNSGMSEAIRLGNASVVARLLDAGALPGIGALSSAATGPQASVWLVELLIDAGASVDTRALDAALGDGRFVIAQHLLDAGALPSEWSITGALRSIDVLLSLEEEIVEEQEIVATLLDAGAVPSRAAIELTIKNNLSVALQALLDGGSIEFAPSNLCDALTEVEVHEELDHPRALARSLEVLEIILRTGFRNCRTLSYSIRDSPAVRQLLQDLDAEGV